MKSLKGSQVGNDEAIKTDVSDHQFIVAIAGELPYLFGRHDFARLCLINMCLRRKSHSIQLRFFLETMTNTKLQRHTVM